MNRLTANQTKTILKSFNQSRVLSDTEKVRALLNPFSDAQFDVQVQGSKVQIHISDSPVLDRELRADWNGDLGRESR